MLPPSTRTVEGALQPAPVRHTTSPFPYFAPTIKPARFRSGITPTQVAFSSRSRGMPRSFAFMISLNTSADVAIRFSGPPHQAVDAPAAEIKIKVQKYFITVLLLSRRRAFLVPARNYRQKPVLPL